MPIIDPTAVRRGEHFKVLANGQVFIDMDNDGLAEHDISFLVGPGIYEYAMNNASNLTLIEVIRRIVTTVECSGDQAVDPALTFRKRGMM